MLEAELDALIEEATADCSNEAGQITGLFTMIEEHLALSLQTTLSGRLSRSRRST